MELFGSIRRWNRRSMGRRAAPAVWFAEPNRNHGPSGGVDASTFGRTICFGPTVRPQTQTAACRCATRICVGPSRSIWGNVITSGTICARAARVQLPILISDVTTDEDWVPFLSFSESAGFGGVLSIPLLSRAGALIGVTSCHFAGRAKPSGSEMKFAQASCEFASDAILEIRRVNGNRPA